MTAFGTELSECVQRKRNDLTSLLAKSKEDSFFLTHDEVAGGFFSFGRRKKVKAKASTVISGVAH